MGYDDKIKPPNWWKEKCKRVAGKEKLDELLRFLNSFISISFQRGTIHVGNEYKVDLVIALEEVEPTWYCTFVGNFMIINHKKFNVDTQEYVHDGQRVIFRIDEFIITKNMDDYLDWINDQKMDDNNMVFGIKNLDKDKQPEFYGKSESEDESTESVST